MKHHVRSIATIVAMGSAAAMFLAGCGDSDSTDASSSSAVTTSASPTSTPSSASPSASTTSSSASSPSTSASGGASGSTGKDLLADRPAAQGVDAKFGQVVTYPNGLKVSADAGTRKAPEGELETNGQQIVVRFIFKNTGSKPYSTASDLTALESADEALGADSASTTNVPFPDVIAPGQQGVATYVFYGDAAQAKTAQAQFLAGSLDTATWNGDVSGALKPLN